MGSSESGNTESYEAGHTEIFFLQMVVCESLLGRGRRFSANIVNKERSARTGRILQYPHPIRAVALKRLNCRVQNCARGSLRGRGLHPAYLIVHIKILPSEGTIFWGGGLRVQRILRYPNGFSSCKGSGTWAKYRVSTCPYASDRL